MALKEYKPEKLLYSMGEVTEMFDVKPSLIRFWEQRFDILKPKKNKKGNRLFTPADVKNLEVIYHLTKERGMTLAGVEKYLKNNKEQAEKDTEIVRRLQTIRSLLVEIREELKEDREDEVRVFTATEPEEPEPTPTGLTQREESTVPDFWSEEPQILPGEVVDPEPEEELQEIDDSGFDGFDHQSESFGLRKETEGLYDHYTAPDEIDSEELIDAVVTEPFTSQPLFELGSAPEFPTDETEEQAPFEPEEKPSAIDTQQSLF